MGRTQVRQGQDLGEDEYEAIRVKELDSSSKKPTIASLPSSPSLLQQEQHHQQLSTAPTLVSPEYAKSIFHIYHTSECDQLLVPHPIDTFDRRFGPKPKTDRKIDKARRALLNAAYDTDILGQTWQAPDYTQYFLQMPYVSFHIPPRTLRRGDSKLAPPICLIKCSPFWKRWKLQFGDALQQPGVVDPRGAVTWRHNGADKKSDDHALKGYKLRSWRLWGETGKRYHQEVNRQRKQGITDGDPDLLPPTIQIKNNGETELASQTEIAAPFIPARADLVLYLHWTSPLSKQCRRYHFTYNGIEFAWKGTGTVRETRKCGFWQRYNHLKLVANVPHGEPSTYSDDEADEKVAQTAAGSHEVCLAKYTSSIAMRKSGMLELYDSAILRFAREYMPEEFEKARSTSANNAEIAASPPFQEEKEDKEEREMEGEKGSADIALLKKTRLYDIITATTLCMIIGEFEKRETIRTILELLASEGGGSAG